MVRRKRRRVWRWVIGALVLLGLAGGAAVGYWWFFTGSAADEVSLTAAVAAISEVEDDGSGDTSNDTATSAPDAGPATTSATASSEPVSESTTSTAPGQLAENLAGTWQLATSGPESFAGYRVQEELANIGNKTVVGRTTDVSATLEFANVASADDTNGDATQGQLVRAEVAVRTATLTTDSSHRDGHARTSLDVVNFPEATFTLTEPIVLSPDGGLAAAPSTWNGEVTGNLSIKGVTRPTTFTINATLRGDILVLVGSAPITFADFEVELPTARIVLSIEEHGVMEFQLYLRRTAPSS